MHERYILSVSMLLGARERGVREATLCEFPRLLTQGALLDQTSYAGSHIPDDLHQPGWGWQPLQKMMQHHATKI